MPDLPDGAEPIHADLPPDVDEYHADPPPESVWLRWGIAFVWLATAVSVLHPSYRAIGKSYLDRIDLPAWLMFATCAGELVLGLALVVRGAGHEA